MSSTSSVARTGASRLKSHTTLVTTMNSAPCSTVKAKNEMYPVSTAAIMSTNDSKYPTVCPIVLHVDAYPTFSGLRIVSAQPSTAISWVAQSRYRKRKTSDSGTILTLCSPVSPSQSSMLYATYTIVTPIISCAGTSHVLRRPMVSEYIESTIGAQNSFAPNGSDDTPKRARSENEAPCSFKINGTAAAKPIGIPCRVYSSSSSAMFG
mmetsp:Transcript_11893/g.30539  ORF Transcript_11893/g.30539 Transcript_11893/m.30539 type:complete len:208 (+) Transcript_11893:4278-4901(+)